MTQQISLRLPVSQDAQAIRQLARDTLVLSVNSTYHYALMARMFNETSIIAQSSDTLCGYITAFRPPQQPDTVFVWQVGVAETCRGKGLGKKMLCTIIRNQQPIFVEASIASNNKASRNLFSSIARKFNADHVYNEPFFTINDLGEREEELLFRIGPIFY